MKMTVQPVHGNKFHWTQWDLLTGKCNRTEGLVQVQGIQLWWLILPPPSCIDYCSQITWSSKGKPCVVASGAVAKSLLHSDNLGRSLSKEVLLQHDHKSPTYFENEQQVTHLNIGLLQRMRREIGDRQCLSCRPLHAENPTFSHWYLQERWTWKEPQLEALPWPSRKATLR